MYQINCRIIGTRPLLQHAFGLEAMAESTKTTARKGKADYSLEWMTTMYVTDSGYLYQPALHIEASMREAAKLFRVKGQGRKTWKDGIRAYALVTPDEILHLRDGEPVPAPDESLLENPNGCLRVNVARAVVQRSAVARSRLEIAEGWELEFIINIQDDYLEPDIVEAILTEAGRAKGIGDWRPRYGLFTIDRFEVLNGQ